jgi:hypothetical protein
VQAFHEKKISISFKVKNKKLDIKKLNEKKYIKSKIYIYIYTIEKKIQVPFLKINIHI